MAAHTPIASRTVDAAHEAYMRQSSDLHRRMTETLGRLQANPEVERARALALGSNSTHLSASAAASQSASLSLHGVAVSAGGRDGPSFSYEARALQSPAVLRHGHVAGGGDAGQSALSGTRRPPASASASSPISSGVGASPHASSEWRRALHFDASPAATVLGRASPGDAVGTGGRAHVGPLGTAGVAPVSGRTTPGAHAADGEPTATHHVHAAYQSLLNDSKSEKEHLLIELSGEREKREKAETAARVASESQDALAGAIVSLHAAATRICGDMGIASAGSPSTDHREGARGSCEAVVRMILAVGAAASEHKTLAAHHAQARKEADDRRAEAEKAQADVMAVLDDSLQQLEAAHRTAAEKGAVIEALGAEVEAHRQCLEDSERRIADMARDHSSALAQLHHQLDGALRSAEESRQQTVAADERSEAFRADAEAARRSAEDARSLRREAQRALKKAEQRVERKATEFEEKVRQLEATVADGETDRRRLAEELHKEKSARLGAMSSAETARDEEMRRRRELMATMQATIEAASEEHARTISRLQSQMREFQEAQMDTQRQWKETQRLLDDVIRERDAARHEAQAEAQRVVDAQTEAARLTEEIVEMKRLRRKERGEADDALARERTRGEEMEARAREVGREVERLRSICESLEARSADERARHATLLEEERGRVAEARREHEALRMESAAARRELSIAREELLGARDSSERGQAALHAQGRDLSERLAASEARVLDLDQELSSVVAESARARAEAERRTAQLAKDLAEGKSSISSVSGRAAELEQEKGAVAAALEEARKDNESLARKLHRARRDAQQQMARVTTEHGSALDAMHAKYRDAEQRALALADELGAAKSQASEEARFCADERAGKLKIMQAAEVRWQETVRRLKDASEESDRLTGELEKALARARAAEEQLAAVRERAAETDEQTAAHSAAILTALDGFVADVLSLFGCPQIRRLKGGGATEPAFRAEGVRDLLATAAKLLVARRDEHARAAADLEEALAEARRAHEASESDRAHATREAARRANDLEGLRLSSQRERAESETALHAARTAADRAEGRVKALEEALEKGQSALLEARRVCEERQRAIEGLTGDRDATQGAMQTELSTALKKRIRTKEKLLRTRRELSEALAKLTDARKLASDLESASSRKIDRLTAELASLQAAAVRTEEHCAALQRRLEDARNTTEATRQESRARMRALEGEMSGLLSAVRDSDVRLVSDPDSARMHASSSRGGAWAASSDLGQFRSKGDLYDTDIGAHLSLGTPRGGTLLSQVPASSSSGLFFGKAGDASLLHARTPAVGASSGGAMMDSVGERGARGVSMIGGYTPSMGRTPLDGALSYSRAR